jgi:RNA polymerase sigma-70 factor (ECF subfamily)
MPQSEPDKFSALLSAEGQPVWRLIVRILGNGGHDAADCFQQAFVELASRHQQLNDIRRAGPLLRRIAAARAIDVVRRRIRDRKSKVAVDESLLPARQEFEPPAQAEACELLDDLRTALTEIPERQAAAFVLTQLEDLPHAEAATAIGVTVTHLGVLLHRARSALRGCLETHNPIREARI